MHISLSVRHSFPHLLFLSIALLSVSLAGCRTGAKLPDKSSVEYREALRAFYVGLAGLQVGDDVRAESKLAQLTQALPEEPAGWANYGLLALRQRNFDAAAERLERARSLAPDNGHIYMLQGVLESNRGKFPEAINALRKAVELDQKNLKASYMLAEQIERQGDEGGISEVQRLLQKILETQPDNLAALIELTRVSAKRGDALVFKNSLARINERSSNWPPEVQQQLEALNTAASGPDPRAAATRIAFLRNVLVRVPEYRQSLSAVKPPPGEEADPFTRPLLLESTPPLPAPPDEALSFSAEPINDFGDGKWDWVGAVSLNGEGAPAAIVANGREVHLKGGATLPFPGGPTSTPPPPDGILALDFNYDFKTDLLLAGAGGVRLFKQDNANSFVDVTTQTALPASITNAAYTGAWAADIEADGDLDIVLGSLTGPPLVLRNNGDGSFKELHPFGEGIGLQDFVWADLDADGDPDAALIDFMGQLHVFTNERTGQFHERPLPPKLPEMRAITTADVSSDGALDLLALQGDGVILRFSDKDEGKAWDVAEIARAPSEYLAGNVWLSVADLDNNGGLDLLLSKYGPTPPAQAAAPGTPPDFSQSGAIVWLGDQSGKFKQLAQAIGPARIFSIADLSGNGRQDLLGLSATGQPVRWTGHGQKNYHWQIIRPRAKQAVGDQRINSFGVGGEMEIRSGLLVQKQPITGPVVHFGLGEQTGADVVRIVWPNGSVRAEFDLQADQTVLAEQRLKGSCPFLFAYNGREMAFVKDSVPWGSAIGLRIDTLGTAGIVATEEWFKISGAQLAPHDGFYDLRMTAELWETYYVDHLSLMVVDHPTGTDIFVDERFSIPPVKLSVTTVATPRPFDRAVDDNGQDATEIVRARDEKYLDNFGRGQYQGLTRDHYVELTLPDDAPASGPLWLIGHGWMHPTDSSINEALGQGKHEKARGLSLEVADGRGGWKVARDNLGIPAGREKTILVDLANIFQEGSPRKMRLRTNLEIYWDALAWAKGLPDQNIKPVRLDAETAELHYRGFSIINQANESSPELPDYNHLSGTTQRWRDLIGYYTRFGDVRELLRGVDDRYVLMNAGDEIALRFAAPDAPPEGWTRDYIIVGDGWIKDGDYNSEFSKTVLPLPSHDRREYTTTSARLEDDPVYQRHPQDWQDYHTRYVTPRGFQQALRQK
ncbi:MAG TPA: FG-GAP-like repeat-containing protein [Pyrinomonadaceae bacterium]|jgi:tetratricopeptide (TPR) repeat protein|nr:FG-GAP-like repeat-containing protein [Pyrinomonadaceae bacterium]